jgi:hypothetical protein
MSIFVVLFAGNVVAATSEPSIAAAKVWATDLPQFLNDHPGQWVVGRSNQPALSLAEAEAMARHDAAEALVDTFQSRLSRSVDRRWLAERIEAALQQDGWIADRQVESNARPYATIWSAAILVEASPTKIDGLASQIERTLSQHRARTIAGILGGAALCTVAGAGYSLLNWLTRGFFRVRLALASFLIAAAGVFGIIHLI